MMILFAMVVSPCRRLVVPPKLFFAAQRHHRQGWGGVQAEKPDGATTPELSACARLRVDLRRGPNQLQV
jgi:hypothetical protein